MRKVLRELEEMVVDAWPASETSELSGWLLRSSDGPTKRANSVVALAVEGDLALDERIASVEAWYRERGKTAVFQLGPSATPKELDAALQARGYRETGHTVFAALAPSRLTAEKPREHAVRIDAKPSEGWLEVVLGASRFADTQRAFLGFLSRLGTRCRFVTAYDRDGIPVAGCLAIASEDRLGIYAMLALPAARGRGAARALLHALAESALREELRELYLLVELDNLAARALYARCGFQDVYTYHYRVAPSSSAP